MKNLIGTFSAWIIKNNRKFVAEVLQDLREAEEEARYKKYHEAFDIVARHITGRDFYRYAPEYNSTGPGAGLYEENSATGEVKLIMPWGAIGEGKAQKMYGFNQFVNKRIRDREENEKTV